MNRWIVWVSMVATFAAAGCEDRGAERNDGGPEQVADKPLTLERLRSRLESGGWEAKVLGEPQERTYQRASEDGGMQDIRVETAQIRVEKGERQGMVGMKRYGSAAEAERFLEQRRDGAGSYDVYARDGGTVVTVGITSATGPDRDAMRKVAELAVDGEVELPNSRSSADGGGGTEEVEIPTQLAFVDEIERRDLPEAEASPATIAWDFGGVDRLEYRLKQEVRVDRGGETQEKTGKWRLTFEPKEGRARVEQTVIDEKRPGPKTTVWAEAYQPDGTFDFEEHPDGTITAMLFPVPSEAMAAGDRASVEARFPLKLQRTRGWLRGTVTVTLERFVRLDGDLAAELRADVDLRDLSQNPNGDKWGETFIKGEGLYYFNVDRGRYASGELAVLVFTDFRDTQMAGSRLFESGVIEQQSLYEYELESASP